MPTTHRLLTGMMMMLLAGATGCGQVAPAATQGQPTAPSSSAAASQSQPASVSGGGATSAQSQAEPSPTPAQPSLPPADTPTAAVQASDGSATSGEPPAALGSSPGESAPAPATSASGSADAGGGAGSVESEPAPMGPLNPYTDTQYGFSLRKPDTFDVRLRPAESFAQLLPQPASVFAVLSPVRASSDLGDLEAPDLEIRIYPRGQANTLEEWLVAHSLLPAGATPQPFQTSAASGVQVCEQSLIGPGCSYFFLGSTWAYQLIPASLEGEAILQTFAVST